ncbi:MAG: DUF3795 domain-containing protein [Promethearchaeota archaeon]
MIRMLEMDGLATPCLLYCGSCRYYMNAECKGCGTDSRPDCEINACCRGKKEHEFCTECIDFPCDTLGNSIGIHQNWLKDQALLPVPKKKLGKHNI